jgi:transposase
MQKQKSNSEGEGAKTMSESTRVNQSPNGMVASRENVSVSSSIEQVPDPEVLPKAKRRNFTQKEKLHILQLADECTQPGQVGALLRREGIYSSYLTTWKDQRDKGLLGTQKVGRPGGDAKDKELARLRAENARLSKKLEQAEMIIDVQKKLSALLGLSNAKTEKDAGR